MTKKVDVETSKRFQLLYHCEPNYCYRNSVQTILGEKNANYFYVEGIAGDEDMLLHHAWVETKTRILELTPCPTPEKFRNDYFNGQNVYQAVKAQHQNIKDNWFNKLYFPIIVYDKNDFIKYFPKALTPPMYKTSDKLIKQYADGILKLEKQGIKVFSLEG
jgi:hypothetical protein